MTQTGVVLGTMRYLAPEVAAGEPATERSDVYSAGRVLEEVGGPAAAIDAMTAEDPAERPASAEAALAALGGGTATAGTARTAPTAVLPGRPQVSWHRSPWFMPAAALAAIALVAIIVVLLATGGGGGATTPQVAPPNAPLQQQLDQLDRAIDSAR
jgi:serine/threonine-protein kinase